MPSASDVRQGQRQRRNIRNGNVSGGSDGNGTLGTLWKANQGIALTDGIVLGLGKLAGDTLGLDDNIRAGSYAWRDYGDRREIVSRRTRRVLNDERGYDKDSREGGYNTSSGGGYNSGGYNSGYGSPYGPPQRTSFDATDPYAYDDDHDGNLGGGNKRNGEFSRFAAANPELAARYDWDQNRRLDPEEMKALARNRQAYASGGQARAAGSATSSADVPAPAVFKGDGSTVTITDTPTSDVNVIKQVLSATDVKVGTDNKVMVPGERVRFVLKSAIAGLQKTPPDTAVLDLLMKDQAAGKNFSDLFDDSTPAEKVENQQLALDMFTGAKNRKLKDASDLREKAEAARAAGKEEEAQNLTSEAAKLEKEAEQLKAVIEKGEEQLKTLKEQAKKAERGEYVPQSPGASQGGWFMELIKQFIAWIMESVKGVAPQQEAAADKPADAPAAAETPAESSAQKLVSAEDIDKKWDAEGRKAVELEFLKALGYTTDAAIQADRDLAYSSAVKAFEANKGNPSGVVTADGVVDDKEFNALSIGYNKAKGKETAAKEFDTDIAGKVSNAKAYDYLRGLGFTERSTAVTDWEKANQGKSGVLFDGKLSPSELSTLRAQYQQKFEASNASQPSAPPPAPAQPAGAEQGKTP